MARYSEAHKRASIKYIKDNYDEILIRVRKGKKEVYKSYAKSKGISLTQLIIDMLDKEIGGWFTAFLFLLYIKRLALKHK